MRVSKKKAAENKVALLRTASRLFRKRGIDGVGVAEVAKEAGLTHGAIYAHFPSKEALAAEAFTLGFEDLLREARAKTDRFTSFREHIDAIFSTAARDELEMGCPMAASACEIGRQDGTISACFTKAFEATVGLLEEWIGNELPVSEKRQLAVTILAARIGAIAVSRAIVKTDTALADEVLQLVQKTLAESFNHFGNRRGNRKSNRK